MTPDQRVEAERLADWLEASGVVNAEVRATVALLRELAAEPQRCPTDGGLCGAGGYCREPSEDRHLRRLLAVRVGMPHTYYDDGEASGQEHGISIDFIREPAADIDAKLRALNVARMECREPQVNPAPGYCKHCQQYIIEEPLPAEPQGEPVARIHVWNKISRFTGQPECHAEPQRQPLTEDQVWADDGIMSANAGAQLLMPCLMELVRAVERKHSIGESNG